MHASPGLGRAALIVVLLAAESFLFWTNQHRLRRVEYVNGLAQPERLASAADASPATSPGSSVGNLIVPERNEEAFNVLAETRQMFATGQWRVRQIDFENAPFGRDVRSPSPYRWWLGFIAWAEHGLTGHPPAISVERAALVADPILHALSLAVITIFVAWQFGFLPAVICCVGMVTLFPFAASFLPGVPDPHGVTRLLGLAAILGVLAGMRRENRRRWFAVAGVLGGLGLWIDVPGYLPVLCGIASGGMLAAWFACRRSDDNATSLVSADSWRAWSFTGAGIVLAAWLLDYFPSHLGGWHLATIHPLYSAIWIAAGEILARTAGAAARGKAGKWFGVFTLAVAVAFAVAPVVLAASGNNVFQARDLLDFRLTNLPDGIVAPGLGAWLNRRGTDAAVWATLLPVIAIFDVAVRMSLRGRPTRFRSTLALALMPALVALGMAVGQLAWWGMCDAALLALLVAVSGQETFASRGVGRWLWLSGAVAVCALGFLQLRPTERIDTAMKLTPAETQELIERDLAHWLGRHADDAQPIIFAPPHETLTLAYYGGLRGIGTFAADNTAGFGTTLAIAGAQTMEEVETQIRLRDVRYVIIPSWDPFFDEFGRLYLNRDYSNRKSLFVEELRRWNLPSWLRPVAYPMPVIGGFEKQSVLVFEVVDPQNPAAAAARLAEYLVETGALDQAAARMDALQRYPGDLGAIAARAQVQLARDDSAGFKATVDLLASRVADGADRFLPWDRRVSLAIVLAQGNRLDLSRAQVQRCLTDIDEKKLRNLSVGSLYRLLVVTHAFGLEINDPALRALALELIPAGLRLKI